ncbi:hypothetical protein H1P_750010 [Hyella patelloides LEGE 07179]|uniref:Uncharacterized protein n=1 Tax=Hyella patelloides LEGE 07179 TaxID=945734 RepID=A0A563W3S1_9CYAN|nr:hypothetical protein [Hyella patelloides]VEP18326.1 hypothetical protein H1P_750010 [Hyella patelloides LEGE 07179]
MKQEIKEKYLVDFCVLLVEEYGYRRWFWFPNMQESELIIWWKQLESVSPYFMTPEPLPGDLYQVKEKDELDLFVSLRSKNQYYVAHIHCDDDSVLIKPSGEKILHQGYEPILD